MVTLKAIFFTVGIYASFLTQTQGDDKYTDGNRPYEFGFSIDGEQHRHEKKDERGLIMGEFGFITADGVYHVTVYATDEQGRFKILSMKNIRTKPYPSYKKPAGSARQGHSLDVQTQQQTVPIQKPDASKNIPLGKLGRSCSSCSIPTTSTAAPIPAFAPNIQNTPIGSNVNNFAQNPASGNPQVMTVQPNGFNYISPQQNLGPSPNFPVNQINNLNNPQTPPDQELRAPKQDSPRYPSNNGAQYPQQPGSLQAYTEQPASNYPQPVAPAYSPLNSESPQNNPYGPKTSFPVVGKDEKTDQPQEFRPVTSTGVQSDRTAKKLDRDQQNLNFAGAQPGNGVPNQDGASPRKPTLISAQMQIVDKNTDIYKRGPGEKEGLPNGLTKDDMTQLLYTFNYTVGFHGHFEEGYRNGAKQGYYYVTGRNGVQTRVDYIADEKGFRPKITQEVLDLLSEDVPKAETEKDEKYGLKGYEFKWLYYPVETKGR